MDYVWADPTIQGTWPNLDTLVHYKDRQGNPDDLSDAFCDVMINSGQHICQPE